MIPIGDDNSTRQSFPFVTYLFIAINIGVFVLQLQGGEQFTREWAYIPREFLGNPGAEAATLISSMFMHGGIAHILGNMVYLWTFGDNIEDRLGHFGYALFYIATGLAAIAAQTAFNPGSNIPNVGASGAIAGVLGAYILLFPHGKVRLLTQVGVIYLPAIIAIGLWFVLQFTGILGALSQTEDVGGVAYMAHIGGFVAGFVLALFFARRAAAA
ncbi:MAG: rhomboid family intramembrane serine protease [Hyphomicrobiales bacterium]|nr:rhomboid family intramembrane serine protease [Hyphomicrobiales bacterium]